MQTTIVAIGDGDTGDIIRRGGLVAFPTETVYGLGGDALCPASSGKIYAAKGRPSDNPLIIHIAEMAALERIVCEIPLKAVKLAEVFWPGPLTMIFKKSAIVPDQTTGGLDTVCGSAECKSVWKTQSYACKVCGAGLGRQD